MEMSIINNKKLVIVIFIFVPFYSASNGDDKYSDTYSKCISDVSSHPDATDCINSELIRQDKMIIEILSKNKDITSPEDGKIIDLNSYIEDHKKEINNKCSLWIKAGGQNGILLERQCVLDETISIKVFLNNFVSAIEG